MQRDPIPNLLKRTGEQSPKDFVPARPDIERPELGAMKEELRGKLVKEMNEKSEGVDPNMPEMKPLDDARGIPEGKTEDQVGETRRPAERGDASEPGYVRLRIHVEDGEARVTAVSHVDGPLVTAEAASGGYLWEVLLDGRMIATDTFGDTGQVRSFPDPKAPATDPRRGHHVADVASIDFTARVPADELPPDALGRAEVGVFRIKDAAKPIRLRDSDRPLEEQFSREIREIARVRALDPETLGRDVAERLRAALVERGGGR